MAISPSTTAAALAALLLVSPAAGVRAEEETPESMAELARQIDSLRGKVALHPEDVEALNSLGYVLGQAGLYEEVIPVFRKAAALRPNYALSHYNLGLALDKLAVKNRECYPNPKEHLDQAQYELSLGLQMGHDPFQSHGNLADVYFLKRLYKEAEAEARAAYAAKPGDAEATMVLVRILMSQGRYDDAINECSWALKRKPTVPEEAMFKAYLGTSLMQKGDLENALPVLTNAADLNPKSAYANYQLSRALRRKGDAKTALAAASDAVTADPKNGWSHLAGAEALRALKRPADALAEADEAIVQKPCGRVHFFIRGMILKDMGRDDEAAKELKRFLKAAKEDPTFKDRWELADIKTAQKVLKSME